MYNPNVGLFYCLGVGGALNDIHNALKQIPQPTCAFLRFSYVKMFRIYILNFDHLSLSKALCNILRGAVGSCEYIYKMPTIILSTIAANFSAPFVDVGEKFYFQYILKFCFDSMHLFLLTSK